MAKAFSTDQTSSGYVSENDLSPILGIRNRTPSPKIAESDLEDSDDYKSSPILGLRNLSGSKIEKNDCESDDSFLCQSPKIVKVSKQNICSNISVSEESSDNEEVVRPPTKRRRILSDSDSNSESHVERTPASKNHDNDFEKGMPSPLVMHSRLVLLQKSFPKKDRSELKDALRSCGWNLHETICKIHKNENVVSNGSANKRIRKLQSKKRVKSRKAFEFRCEYFPLILEIQDWKSFYF